jgi:glycosyltransferase involved in cell wall biosynthesis
MRILYLLTTLGVGGAEKQARAIAERMAKRGHTVVLMVLLPRVAEEWPTTIPAEYLGLRKTPLSVSAGFRRARRLLLNFRPDLVHSHGFHANVFARLLRLLHPRFPVLSTVHNVYEGGWRRMLAYRLTDGLSRRTVAVSEAAAQRFTRLKAVPKLKCSVVRNGIDTEEFSPNAERRAKMRAKLRSERDVFASLEDDEFVWLAVGRLTEAKDYPNLLNAFADLHTQRPDARLWIAGEAALGQIAAFQSMRQELGLGDEVRWLGLRRDIPALLDAADAFVLSSAWEGMPLAVGEAMAMEKSVVATDVGGVRELVGDAGVVVPAKNPGALAEAMIATMQQSREALAARGRAARERVMRQFSMDATADAWEALYKQLSADSE